MTRYLLDVNVLLALIDPDHIWHEVAHRWFASSGSEAWATCPITQMGVIRIAGSARYPNSAGTPAVIASMMTRFCASPGHEFWPDHVNLFEENVFKANYLSSSKQVTDTYLLALAGSRGGQLATFDRRIITSTVERGTEILHLIA